ncbi:ATP phosphoribosyltransferase regulatory subunit [Saccharothrix sp. BKS2]|uniref:ATP phosphoribosyltransferase regulatory subunit n=1 Tax=Saccharothrix sp. BKS2 TaxID=3064400 RepID=UPI0039EC02D7
MNPRPESAGGFPEWPPGLRAVEVRWLDRVRRVFESHGFGPVATSSLEPPEEEPGEALAVGDGDLALCADLTASFARWAADHRDELDLPFRGRQAQRVWRGSREDGVRESTWCALGVVDAAPLSPRLDAELPRVAHEALSGLDLPAWTLGVGNRRVLAGFCEGLGVDEPLLVLRAVARLDELGADRVAQELRWALTTEQVYGVLQLAEQRDVAAVRRLGVESDLLDRGLDEVEAVLAELTDLPEVVPDFSVVGPDHCAGTVYGGRVAPGAGSAGPWSGGVCSGGRYAGRAGLSGVGLAVDLGRLFAAAVDAGLVARGPGTPTEVLVVPRAGRYGEAAATAAALRRGGLNVEIHHAGVHHTGVHHAGVQHREDDPAAAVRRAGRLGIPFAWFPPAVDGEAHEVLDLGSGERVRADPAAWSPRR